VSGSGISWGICKSALCSSNPTLSFFTGRMPFLPPNQQRQSIEGITECSAVKTSLDLNDARDDRVLAWQ